MSVNLLIVTIAIGILLWLFIKRAAKGPKRNLAQLERPIEDLLSRGFADGILILTHTRSERFLQFSKYFDANKQDFGIEINFPHAEWSKDYYEHVKDKCAKRNLDYKEMTTDDGMKFIDIDFSKDTGTAFKFVCEIFANVMGLDSNDQYYVELSNASID